MRVLALCCLLLAGIGLLEAKKSYRGYRVLSAMAQNERQVSALQHLHDTNHELIFLSQPTKGRATEVVVSPGALAGVMNTLQAVHLNVSVQSSDLQAEFDAVMAENTANQMENFGRLGEWNHTSQFLLEHKAYYNMDQINEIMLYFNDAYPQLAIRQRAPYLSELGDEIFYLKLGTYDPYKPVIMIEGMAHAREWIVPASLIYSIDKMLEGYHLGEQLATEALTKYTWIIIPVVNPDGYRYTWSHDRLWRKNRKYITSQCTGVDLNRNYDVDYAQTGASSDCRRENFHGSHAFSESETKNVRTLFEEHKVRVVSFLSVHAYSQLLLYPWGYVPSVYDPNPPSNLQALISLGEKMQQALQSQGKTYKLGTAFGVLGYAASGAAEDWALQEKANIYAYCYELRPQLNAQNGFVIMPREIVPTGIELLRSFYVLAQGIM